MLQVVYIFRKKNPQAFSIEKVFDLIIKALPPVINAEQINLPAFSSGLMSILKNIRAIKKDRNKIYHITGDVHYMMISLPSSHTVLTIHDLVFLNSTFGFKKRILKYLFLDLPVRKAKYITTISESSRNEIIKHSGCASEKILVVPDPVDPAIQYVDKKFNSTNPLILFLGTKPNKNLDQAIKALKDLKLTVHIVGKLNEKQLNDLELNRIAFRNSWGLTQQEIADAYTEADIILFPSVYEGFGLPIIEGFKAGRVVVTSNILPMNEISGGAACLCDPFDERSIRDAVMKVISDEQYRNALIQKGLSEAEKYSPEVIASKYLDLYSRIASE